MTTVITTVGTSLITNYMKPEVHDSLKGNYTCIQKAFEKIEKVSESKYDEQEYKINITKIQDAISNKWIKGIKWVKEDDCWEIDETQTINCDASAEISSLLAIQEKLKDSLDVRLIATETILSRLAAEVIRDKLNGYKTEDGKTITVEFEPEKTGDKCDVIQGLDVENADNFRGKGLPNLIERLKALGISKDEIILNITGGYKGVIPFLTILGQIYENVEIMYLYEESKDIIKIPKLPVSFDWSVLEEACLYLKDEYLKSTACDSVVIDFLSKKHLIKEPNNDISSVGYLVKNTLNSKTPYGAVLGDIVELKLLEYYINNPEADYPKAFRGVKSLNLNGKIYQTETREKNYGDLDIVLLDNLYSKFICIEAKPYSGIEKVLNEFFKTDKGSLNNRLCFFKTNGIKPDKFILVIHSLDISDISIYRDELKKCQKIFMEKGIPSFEVRQVIIDTSQKNPYAKFVNNEIFYQPDSLT